MKTDETCTAPKLTGNANTDINVTIQNLVVTPLTCAGLICEILRVFLYQTSQIPYPYNWLESVVKRKRNSAESGDERRRNLTAERFFRTVSSMYDIVEETLKNIHKEFKESASDISEILFILGPIPSAPVHVFSIKTPRIETGHHEANHLYTASRKQHVVLRDIFLSENWFTAIKTSVPCTNLYVMLKKYIRLSDTSCDQGNFFLLKRNYNLPSRIKITSINLVNNCNDSVNCCENLTVFCDNNESETESQDARAQSESCIDFDGEYLWFQAKDIIKGFKDCCINSESVSNLW